MSLSKSIKIDINKNLFSRSTCQNCGKLYYRGSVEFDETGKMRLNHSCHNKEYCIKTEFLEEQDFYNEMCKNAPARILVDSANQFLSIAKLIRIPNATKTKHGAIDYRIESSSANHAVISLWYKSQDSSNSGWSSRIDLRTPIVGADLSQSSSLYQLLKSIIVLFHTKSFELQAKTNTVFLQIGQDGLEAQFANQQFTTSFVEINPIFGTLHCEDMLTISLTEEYFTNFLATPCCLFFDVAQLTVVALKNGIVGECVF